MKIKAIAARTPEALAHTLGLTLADAREWQTQHLLLRRLRQIAKAESLTHAQVAKLGGSSRTRVTAILNGSLDNVSTDLLIRLLGALGDKVRISASRIDPAAQRKSAAPVRGRRAG